MVTAITWPLMRRLLMVGIAYGCLSWSGACLHPQEASEIIAPHPQTQRLLVQFFELIQREYENASLHQNELDIETQEIWRRFLELRRVSEDDRAEFVQQEILAIVTDRLDGDFDIYVLLDFVGTSEVGYAAGLSGLLYCDNEEIRREAWGLFSHTYSNRVTYQVGVDMAGLRVHVTGEHQIPEVATPLKRAIFERMPQAAFLMFVSTVSLRSGESYRRLERTVDNALYQKRWLGGIPDGKIDEETATALRMLGHDAHWWARMYAAETMVQNKEFRDDDLIARLKDDEHELVRGSIASLTTPDPLRAAEVDK